MSIDLPTPIALYIATENRGDADAMAKCFAEDAVVRDEGRTIKGLAAIKQWKAETKKKYQHTVEALALTREGDKTIVTNRSRFGSSSGSTATGSRRSRSAEGRSSNGRLTAQSAPPWRARYST